MSTYEDEQKKRLEAASKRVSVGIAASNFLATPEGQLIQEWINERISQLMEKLSGKTPVDDREYLSIHGGLRELKDFNVMLQAKALAVPHAQEEVEAIKDELAAAKQ